MWCQDCRQDVPAIASGEPPEPRCPRCGSAVRADTLPSRGEFDVDDLIADLDGWELDEELRHIRRMLEAAAEPADGAFEPVRFDGAEVDGLPPRHVPSLQGMAKRSPPNSHGGDTAGRILTWLALAAGTTGFVCGGVLLGWSLAAGRQALWNIGLPTALGGQILLAVGLALHLDRLWRDPRAAATIPDAGNAEIHASQSLQDASLAPSQYIRLS